MKDIIIIGAGGVGREVISIIEQINIENKVWNIVGIIDDNSENWNKEINGYKVLGGLNILDRYKDKSLSEKPSLFIAIANYKVKKTIVKQLNNEFEFATIIHPNIYIDKSTEVGYGTVIYPNTVITTNIKIGNHVIISPKCGIGHDSIIKDYCSILWNVNISGNDVIEEGAMMGSASAIIQGKTIGKGAIIGAGALVINDIEENTTNVGVPSKIIKR